MKRIGILVLSVVIALGAIGIGYAAWSQNLDIVGTAASASFDVHFNADATNVSPSSADAGGAYLSLTKGLTDKYFSVGLINGYPGFAGDASYVVVNSGSTPVNVKLQYSTDGLIFNDWDGTAKTPISGTTATVTVTNALLGTPLAGGNASEPGTLHFAVTGTADAPVAAVGPISFWVRIVASYGS